MKVMIPIKQVPETSNVKMDPETGTMIREGVESIINPLDLYAIESGIRIKEAQGGTVIALSMGPPKAEEALREAVAMGCDSGLLLSDKCFAGSDTWATSYCLSRAIQTLGDYDLILCGERATDGDTGQVGPGIAAWLDIPVGTYISEICEIRAGSLVVKRLVEDGYETLEMETPCLLTVVKEVTYPRLPTLRGKQRAQKIEIPIWGSREICANMQFLGSKGSPTRVVNIESSKITQNGDIRFPKDAPEMEEAIEGLVRYLEKNRTNIGMRQELE